MRLIGLAGYGGVGKDTAADILVESRGFTKFSFSDDLYREVAEAFDVGIDWLKDRENKDRPQPFLFISRCKDKEFVKVVRAIIADSDAFESIFSPRQLLQWWGTEYRRAQDPLYWIKRATEFAAAAGPGVKLVNTSVRFGNEIGFIKGRGGEVWQVVRSVQRPNGHAAEVGIDDLDIDRVVLNTGTIDELRELLMGLVK